MRVLLADPLGTEANHGGPGQARGSLVVLAFHAGLGGVTAGKGAALSNPTKSLFIFWDPSAKVPLLPPVGSQPLVWVPEGQAACQHSGDPGGGGSSALEPRAYPLCSDLRLLACLRSMSDSCGGEQPLQTDRLLRLEVAKLADTPRKQLECVSVLRPVKPLPFRAARSLSHFHTRRAPVDGSTAKRHRVRSPPLRCRVLC